MALPEKVLQKKAEKCELKKLQVIEVNKERLYTLDTLLEDVYATRRPKPTDYVVRKDLIRVFNAIAKEIYDKSKDIPAVVEFGSFVMDLFSTTSDLDLSVNFSTSADCPRGMKIQTLKKFAKKLYALQSMGHVYGVLPITSARVPVLKCVDRGTGVECDISVENRDGISKSQIIGIISSIDERFKKLSFLLKTWAKAQNVNSSKDKTLNSLSIILLVAFHLQTRNPPILPPFSAIFKDGNDPAAVEKSVPFFVNYGKQNKESLAELFITLLLKLSSAENLWPKGLCASTYTASWISKTWGSKVASISVEDFSDRSQNVARAVGVAQVKQIYKCINSSIRNITAFMNGQIGLQLKDLLFGGVDGMATSIPGGVPNSNMVAPFSCIPSQANHNRGMVAGRKRKKPGLFPKTKKLRTRSHPGMEPWKQEQVQGIQPWKQDQVQQAMLSHPGIQSWKQEQVQPAMLAESSFSNSMHTDEGWRGVPNGSFPSAQVGTPHLDLSSSQQCYRGLGGEMYATGGTGWERAAAQLNWVETYNPRSEWGVSQHNRWQVMQQPGSGWEATQQPNVGPDWWSWVSNLR